MTLHIHHMALQTPVYRQTPAALQTIMQNDTVHFPFATTEEFFILQRAISLAHRIHKGEQRLNGAEYLTHPLATMRLLLDTRSRLPFSAYITAILHDVLEHDPLASAEICATFGDEVFQAVWALSRPFRQYRQSHQKHEDMYIEKMLRVQSIIPYVILIKMADCLHNLQTIDGLPRQERERYIRHILDLYLPTFKQIAVRSRDTEIAEASFKLIDGVGREMRQADLSP